MSPLSLAGGAFVAGIWKVATLALAVLLLVVTAGTGTGWWLAAAARDQALASLAEEQRTGAQLRGSIALQNSVVDEMARTTKAANDRRDVAEQYASIAIKATGAREAAARASTATSCDGVLREAWGQR